MYLRSDPVTWLLISQLTSYSESKNIGLKDEFVEEFLVLPTRVSQLDIAWRLAFIVHY